MKMSDVLHSIADMLDQKEDGRPGNSIEAGSKILKPAENETEHGGAGDVEVGAFTPPLQQKLDLLKKAAGEGESDELADIKKLSGMPSKAAVIQVTSDDTDIES